jgi:hypothetical protein
MTQIKIGAKKHSHRWLTIGAIVLGLFSLLVSWGDLRASDSVGMIGTTSGDAAMGVWIMAVIAILVCLWCAWVLIGARPGLGRNAKLVGDGLALVLVPLLFIGPALAATNAISASAPHNDQVRQALLAAIPACRGQTPIAGAAAYGGAVHPMEVVYIPANGATDRTQADVAIRAGTLAPVPDTIDAIQLVVCLGDQTTVTLQTCNYSMGGTYTRYAHDRDVFVYEAASGQLLEQKTFEGSHPSDCPDTKAVGKGEASGDDVNWDDSRIWDYIGTWLVGPMPSASPTDNP